jgi:hypothetical protein
MAQRAQYSIRSRGDPPYLWGTISRMAAEILGLVNSFVYNFIGVPGPRKKSRVYFHLRLL